MLHLFDESIVPHGAMMFHIHDDTGRLGVGGLQHSVEEILQVVHHLVTFADQSIGFVGIELKHQMTVPRSCSSISKTKPR